MCPLRSARCRDVTPPPRRIRVPVSIAKHVAIFGICRTWRLHLPVGLEAINRRWRNVHECLTHRHFKATSSNNTFWFNKVPSNIVVPYVYCPIVQLTYTIPSNIVIPYVYCPIVLLTYTIPSNIVVPYVYCPIVLLTYTLHSNIVASYNYYSIVFLSLRFSSNIFESYNYCPIVLLFYRVPSNIVASYNYYPIVFLSLRVPSNIVASYSSAIKIIPKPSRNYL